MKFISDGTWFDKGTEVKILVECGTVYNRDTGIPTLSVLAAGFKNGNPDEEMCTMEEFMIVDNSFDVHDFHPQLADLKSQEFLDGHKAAELAITKNESHKNPYDNKTEYTKWNNWAAGNYYGMK